MLPFLMISILLAPTTLSAKASFAQFLETLRNDAENQGIRTTTLALALNDLESDPRVLARYNHQPEKKQSLKTYLARRVSPNRVAAGRLALTQYRTVLDSIAGRFGVQARFVVALWGSESDYGRNIGDFSVIRSLATLAHATKRGNYFRRELLEALLILDQGHIPPNRLVGSWAGAMGQCQFMPWSYNHRAVDFDADGHKDIWHSREDALASIANFLSAHGWRNDLTWGRPVTIPPNLDPGLENAHKNLSEWQALGVSRLNGSDLPLRDISAQLIAPPHAPGEHYLVYENYSVLLKWNRSHHFAIAVGTLSDHIIQ